MKNLFLKQHFCLQLLFVVALLSTLHSCNILGDSTDVEGQLRISFAPGQEILTRSGIDIPDTCDFILTVKDAKGSVVYEGPFGASPETMSLKSGSYTISVISQEFPKPTFSLPQFGDEQCILVSSGEIADVKLVCRQINSGIRLKIDQGFLDKYPDGSLLLKSSFGKLLYSYSEKRMAYFTPGSISLILSNRGTDNVLLTRTLREQENLELRILVSGSKENSPDHYASGISVSVDTTRVWLSEEYVLGGGGSNWGVLSVSDALSMIGEEDVWVCGYIVGGDLTSSSASFERPFSSRTNLLLGPRSSTDDKYDCLSVQLVAGDIRDELNLVDNPQLLGRKICLKGDIVSAYYGIPGMKNISEFELQ